MDPVRALVSAEGVARWKDLYEAGVSRGRLLEAVQSGTVVRAHRGVYALPGASFVDVEASIFRATPCCLSVLRAHQIAVVPYSHETHLAVPDSRSLARPGIRPMERIVAHRSLVYPRDSMGEIAVALDMSARCLERAAQLGAIEAAIRAGHVTKDVIESFRVTSTARREWLRQRLDLSSDSAPETMTRVALRDAGLPVRTQVQVEGVGRVDFVVGDRTAIECDGFAYHSRSGAYQEDRRRSNVLQLRGYIVLRYTYEDVVERRDQIIEDARAALWRTSRAA